MLVRRKKLIHTAGSDSRRQLSTVKYSDAWLIRRLEWSEAEIRRHCCQRVVKKPLTVKTCICKISNIWFRQLDNY